MRAVRLALAPEEVHENGERDGGDGQHGEDQQSDEEEFEGDDHVAILSGAPVYALSGYSTAVPTITSTTAPLMLAIMRETRPSF